MKNIEDINKAAVTKILADKKISSFSPGDTIKVGVRIVEGKKERIQYFRWTIQQGIRERRGTNSQIAQTR